MKLTLPKVITFVIAVALGVLGFIGWLLLILGLLIKGLQAFTDGRDHEKLLAP